MEKKDGEEGDRSCKELYRPTRTRLNIWHKTKKKIENLAKKEHLSFNAFVQKIVLEEIGEEPQHPPQVSDEIIALLPSQRPNALVYHVPVVGTKIVASSDGEGSWRGVCFDPQKPGSTFAWTANDLNISAWAKKPKIVRALLFVSSRVDDDGLSHFRVPNSNLIVSAQWKGNRWEDGFVTDTKNKERQAWERGGWYSNMAPGPFNLSPELRRHMNMLCCAMTVGDGALEKKIPI